MNILVTGAAGQLGRELQNVAAGSKDNYIFTDLATGYEHLDITSLEAIRTIIRDKSVSVAVNCAAYTDVDKAESDKAAASMLNSDAPGYLAKAMQETGGKLVQVSTDYVFDGNANVPYNEDCPTGPTGVYGRTKLEGERNVLSAMPDAIIVRTAWLYSPYGRNFVKTIRRIAAERDSIKVVFDQVGTPTYAKDLAAAIFSIIESRQLDKGGIYHFSNEGVCSWYDFAKAICRLSGISCEVLPCHSDEFPSPVNRPHYSVLDKAKIKETFGFKVPYWADSLSDCISKME